MYPNICVCNINQRNVNNIFLTNVEENIVLACPVRSDKAVLSDFMLNGQFKSPAQVFRGKWPSIMCVV